MLYTPTTKGGTPMSDQLHTHTELGFHDACPGCVQTRLDIATPAATPHAGR